VTALIALASSLVFGMSDFIGGVAARRESVFRVTAWGQIVGMGIGLVLAALVAADGLSGTDLTASLAAGLTTSFSVVCFYAALSRGAMSVVAPITGVLGASVPAVFGIVRGDDTPATTAVGLLIAVLAILLVTYEDDHDGSTGRDVVALAVIAGVGFGLFFIALEQTDDSAGLWPVVIARLVSVPTTALLAVRLTGGLRLQPITLRLAAAAGASEMIANALILVALRRDELAVAGVFGSLYPVATVLLAWLLLRERLRPAQLLGISLAIAALVMVAV
jgi:drug/metabolite transporter (DMT)-like permease